MGTRRGSKSMPSLADEYRSRIRSKHTVKRDEITKIASAQSMPGVFVTCQGQGPKQTTSGWSSTVTQRASTVSAPRASTRSTQEEAPQRVSQASVERQGKKQTHFTDKVVITSSKPKTMPESSSGDSREDPSSMRLPSKVRSLASGSSILKAAISRVHHAEAEKARSRWRWAIRKIRLACWSCKAIACFSLAISREGKILSFSEIADQALDGALLSHITQARETDMTLSKRMQTIFGLRHEDRTPEDIAAVLSGLQCIAQFCAFPLNVQENIARYGSFLSVGKRRVLIRQGHSPEYWYFIINGQAIATEVVIRELEGVKTVVNSTCGILKKGMSFGDREILLGTLRRFTVTSRAPMHLVVVSKELFPLVFRKAAVGQEEEVPGYIKFIRDLDFMRFWPWRKLVQYPSECYQHYQRRDQVVVPDSTKSDWIYVVESGECTVYMFVESTRASWRDLELHLSHPTVNINRWPEGKVDTGPGKLPHRRSAYTLYNQLDSTELKECDPTNLLHLALGPPYDLRAFPVRLDQNIVTPCNSKDSPPDSHMWPPGSRTSLSNTKLPEIPAAPKSDIESSTSGRSGNTGDMPQTGSDDTLSQTDGRVKKTNFVPLSQGETLSSKVRGLAYVSQLQKSGKIDVSEEGEEERETVTSKSNLKYRPAAESTSAFQTAADAKKLHGAWSTLSMASLKRRRQRRKKKDAISQWMDMARTTKYLRSTTPTLQRRRRYRVPKACQPPTPPPQRKPANPYVTRTPPLFVVIDKLTTGDVFGLDQLERKGFEESRTASYKVALVSDGAELIMLNKRFFMAYANDRTLAELIHTARIYPSPESVQTRLRLHLAWQLWQKKVVQELREDLVRRGRTVMGCYFQEPTIRTHHAIMNEQ